MKTFFAFCLVILLSMGVSAQVTNKPLYLLFEFMKVNGGRNGDYLKVEEFWSGIHKQRVADKSILGWDLWYMIPSGTGQASQYLTVTLFPSLEGMLKAIESLDVMSYAKKAYPGKTDKELAAMLDQTIKSRDLAYQVLFRKIDNTKDEFNMKVGTLITMDIMKRLDESYEKVESEIFKPWHQQMVNDGKKGSWRFLQTILPSGSEAYGTHLTVSMFENEAQLAAFMENQGGRMDYSIELAVRQGLKTRDLKETRIGKLIMTVQ